MHQQTLLYLHLSIPHSTVMCFVLKVDGRHRLSLVPAVPMQLTLLCYLLPCCAALLQASAATLLPLSGPTAHSPCWPS